MEQQREGRIMEEREELMVSPTGDGKPTLRMAHFLNPSLSSNDNPLHTLSPLSLSSKTSKTQTQKNPLKVSFKGWRNPQKKWKIWVDHMCSLHKPLWEKAGIYESIMGSVYSIRKDCELVIKVAEKWCPETNSFVFPFGEATVTLEDMMTLGGYSVLGDSVLTPLPLDLFCVKTWCRHQLVFGAMVRDVTVMVTIGDGAGVLLPQQFLNHRIVFFILSRSGMVGVVSWHPILSIVGIATTTETKKKTSKSKTKTILFSIIISVIYQIKGDKSTRTPRGLSSSMPMSPQPL